MIWRATQADRDGICCMRGGLHCFCQLHSRERIHTHRFWNGTHKHIFTYTHTQYVNYMWLVAFQMPPGPFLSICGDRMTILPPTSWPELSWTAHRHTHIHTRTLFQKLYRNLPLPHWKSAWILYWQHSRQQNKQAPLQWYIYLTTPMPSVQLMLEWVWTFSEE